MIGVILWLILGLILVRWATQLWLECLNRRRVQAHASTVPEPFHGMIDQPTYMRSVEYTLAKGRLAQFETTYDTLLLIVVLFSGLLPWALTRLTHYLGESAWAMATYLFTVGLTLSLPGLPLAWYHQFRLEQRFGFNTTTQKLWWLDRGKAFVLGSVIGFPLLLLILKLVDWTAQAWWLWAWGALLAFQLLMSFLAPIVILPLFNKFTPLPEGSLRERLLRLAERTRFRTRSIQIMDGSKRSRHSNAFFTGFGRFRKIVLFDTLIQQLAESELEAVLAHEIGHFNKKHIPKMLLFSAVASLVGFYILSQIAKADLFYRSFGFEKRNIAVALLLFALLSGLVTFWFSPLAHWWSRRYEYQADAFAQDVTTEPASLVRALRKLNQKNLTNLTPHPMYSRFYYSHPTLLEREQALQVKAESLTCES
jgi:STE24 endopeptidase